MNNAKVGIIGAGNVGIRYAYSLIIGGLARTVVIVDRDKKRAEGEALDLNHGMPYLSPVHIYAGDYTELKDSDLIVITAGIKQKPGQTRLDLVKGNVRIIREIVPEIMKYAPEAVLCLVSNPVDILAYAAYKISGKPSDQVIGSGTVLDSARLRFLLSRHCGIDARNIHAYILGEHGDSEFPVWSRAMIGGILLNDYCPVCGKCDSRKIRAVLFQEVRDSAYKIIECKGETSYGIGLALTRISEAVLKDENSVLPVSCLVNDFYGIHDVYLSLPVVVGRNGVKKRLALSLDGREQQLLKVSAEKLRSVIREAGI